MYHVFLISCAAGVSQPSNDCYPCYPFFCPCLFCFCSADSGSFSAFVVAVQTWRTCSLSPSSHSPCFFCCGCYCCLQRQQLAPRSTMQPLQPLSSWRPLPGFCRHLRWSRGADCLGLARPSWHSSICASKACTFAHAALMCMRVDAAMQLHKCKGYGPNNS